MAKKKEEAKNSEVLEEKEEAKAKTEEKSEGVEIPEKVSGEEYRAALLALAAAQKEIAEEKKKSEETEDRYLRILAEYDNFKKRSAREKDELFFSAKAEVIRKILPVFDNFERAQKFSDGSDYAKGVDMIISQFFQIAESLEIREIAKVGDEFDPNFHEAVMREEKEGVAENTVTEVLQKGYAVSDKVIRHAMVKVSV